MTYHHAFRYRASIISKVDNEKVRVFYVDYGNEEIVSINNLRIIPLQLVKKIPQQAIKCSLNGFQSGPMDKELTSLSFESLVLEERLNLLVVNNLSNTTVVELYKEDDASVDNPPNTDITALLRALATSKKQGVDEVFDRFSETTDESSLKLQVKNQK